MVLADALLLLGTNLGNKQENLLQACMYLEKEAGKIWSFSGIYVTEPWGKWSQNTYYNQAIVLQTTLTPVNLLDVTQSIELKLGRITSERWSDRLIDIDLLLYNSEIIETDRLQLPHKEMLNRRFALVPSAEIAGHWIHPLTGQTIKWHESECPDKSQVGPLFL